MKLAITYYGIDRQGLWSGTFDRIERSLSCYKWVKVEWLCIAPAYSWLFRKFLVAYCRIFFYGDGVCREKQVYKKVWKTALNKIGSCQSEWVLMVAEHCLNRFFPTDKRYACYIDSDFSIIAQTSPIKTKPGFNYYIRNYDKYTRVSYDCMNLIFTQNEWTRRSVIERFGLPEDKVYNVRFGINVEPYRGEKDYKEDLLLIVLREYNHYVKGLDMIVEALPMIRNEYPEVRLAVVGNNAYEGIEGVDCYVGYPREKTKELFKRATLYVMPSRNEPNGITYLEALANKTPFVALNRYAASEFSGNGDWSFLCDTDTPQAVATVVCEALADKHRLYEMGKRGQQFVMENYNWDNTVATMIKLMDEYESKERH